jgi:hypothetical protein
MKRCRHDRREYRIESLVYIENTLNGARDGENILNLKGFVRGHI